MLVTCFPTAAWLTSSACADAAVGLALRHRCQDVAPARAEPVNRAVVLTAASMRPTTSASSALPPPANRRNRRRILSPPLPRLDEVVAGVKP
jgi:hypothetical protein